jgi:hypothetical protein
MNEVISADRVAEDGPSLKLELRAVNDGAAAVSDAIGGQWVL